MTNGAGGRRSSPLTTAVTPTSDQRGIPPRDLLASPDFFPRSPCHAVPARTFSIIHTYAKNIQGTADLIPDPTRGIRPLTEPGSSRIDSYDSLPAILSLRDDAAAPLIYDSDRTEPESWGEPNASQCLEHGRTLRSVLSHLFMGGCKKCSAYGAVVDPFARKCYYGPQCRYGRFVRWLEAL